MKHWSYRDFKCITPTPGISGVLIWHHNVHSHAQNGHWIY